MSSIELAAKRLEELRRSGVDLGDSKPVPSIAVPPPRSDAAPTPEAVVRALDARPPDMRPVQAVAAPLARPERVVDVPADLGLAIAQPAAGRTPGQSRRVEIDLARLAVRGFVTPDAPKSQLADEFRIIKRPIIQNALGRNGAQVKHRNLVHMGKSH